MTKNLQFISNPASTIRGEIRVPGDKSISHRSVMLGALATGTTRASGFLQGDDCLATMQAFQKMGADIQLSATGELTVEGLGLHGLTAPGCDIDLGNSGTSIRLMSGILAGQTFESTLTGDESLCKRPMRRVTAPLALMGADISTSDSGKPPLHIKPVQQLTAIDYQMPMASAQVKSCVLLAGLYADSTTTVTEPAPTRDHSERMLRSMGATVVTKGSQITLNAGAALSAIDIEVPADISSAAFFLVAASIAKDADILLQHVGLNPTRTGVIDILKLMGANITIENQREVGSEPVADIHVRSAELQGIDIPESLVPLAIDEFPALFIAAASATGTTRLTGAEELRVKESDRIQSMVDGLKTCGINAEGTPDGAIIEGGQLTGGRVESHHDHRVAMAFSIAALRSTKPITIDRSDIVATSFPGFVELCNRIGLNIEQQYA